jgi:hypothetical protein
MIQYDLSKNFFYAPFLERVLRGRVCDIQDDSSTFTYSSFCGTMYSGFFGLLVYVDSSFVEEFYHAPSLSQN